MKTKPTQHSVKELRGLGIQPNILVVRTEQPVGQSTKNKLAQFCDVAPEAVIESRDVETLYSIPLALQAQGMDQIVCDHLKLTAPAADMTEWQALEEKERYTHLNAEFQRITRRDKKAFLSILILLQAKFPLVAYSHNHLPPPLHTAHWQPVICSSFV